MAVWDHYARLLRREKESLEQQLGEEGLAGKMVAFRDSVTDLSFADNHPADLGSENFERSKDLALNEHRLARLRLIEEALERIAGGDYGICPRCGANISAERLDAAPEAPFCFHCQEFEERRLRASGRPAEEGILLPPYVRRNVPGSPASDTIEIWEQVAEHNRRPRMDDDRPGEEDEG